MLTTVRSRPLVLAAGLALGMSLLLAAPVQRAMALEPNPAQAAQEAAKKAAEEAKLQAEAAAKKAVEDAKKAAEAAAGAGTAQPATTPAAPAEPVNPKAIPVPTDLPVISTSTVDGVKIEELKIGDGLEVKPGGLVSAHYHGTLKDGGKKFDSSFERGEPATFPLAGVIPGWQKGVPGMKVGGIRRLTIPSDLAYGQAGAGSDIPPNSDLVFIIQLVGTVGTEDITVGTGEEVGSRAVVVTAFTIKGEDGKVIESATKEAPFVWVPGEHQGINAGVEGMKVGGKRKLTLPAAFNTTTQGAPNPNNRPNNVPVTVEIELIAVKNLVPVTRR